MQSPIKEIHQLIFFSYLPPSRVPDEKIDIIPSAVRAVRKKRRAEPAYR